VIRFRQNGDIWFGTNDGLFVFRASSKSWERFFHGFGKYINIVNEVFCAKDGSLWIGTEDGVEIRSKDGISRFYSVINDIPLRVVTAINQDQKGHVWIGSGASFTGTFRWDGKEWRHFKLIQGLDPPYVHKIRKDKNGPLWFLGLGRDFNEKRQPGAFQLKNGIFIHWGSKSGLIDGRVYDFEEDSAGSYWLATRTGISRLKNGRWTNWTKADYNGSRALCLALHGGKQIWFADGANGLRYIDQNDGIHFFTTDDGLLDNQVQDLDASPDGRLWIATAKGLQSYHNGVLSTFDHRAGLPTPRLNCVLPLADKVYVGSPGGGVSVLNLNETNYPTRIGFERPVVENETALLRWKAYSYWGNLPPGEIETRYRIDNGKWSPWAKDKEITLFNMPEGEHTVTVQAKDLFGSFDTTGASVTFRIEPPYYKQPEFLAPVALLSLLTMLLGFNTYRGKRQHSVELQTQRDRIASDLHDEVGSNLGSIGLISQRLLRKGKAPRRYRDDLHEITRLSMATAETLREIVWYVNPKRDSFTDLLAQMRSHAEVTLRNIQYTFAMNNGVQQLSVGLEFRRNIYLMFKEIVHNVVKHANATMVCINVQIQRELFLLEVQDNGDGFDATQSAGGDGLKNLTARARLIGGILRIESATGKGTTVRLTAKFT
jgi:ligand-binding sensor domain-containing protein